MNTPENRIFITGATGFIGSHLLDLLVSNGYIVHALYRSSNTIPLHASVSVKWFKGDILEVDSIEKAIKGCSCVIHAAAFAKTWLPKKKIILHHNVLGTYNVLNASLNEGIQRVVYISSAGVFQPPGKNTFINECTTYNKKPFTPYDHSKILAEKLVAEFVNKGLPVIIVNPTRVFGPGILNEANSVTKMILAYVSGKWNILPSNGNAIGNYVYISDVVKGVFLALTKGESGEKYILAGENCSYNTFFEKLKKQSNSSFRLWKIPAPLMFIAAYFMVLVACLTGSSPKITPGLVRKFLNDWRVSSEKAEKTLGYSYMGLEEGLTKTLQWFSSHNSQ